MALNVEVIKTGEDSQFAYYNYQYKGLVDNKPRTLTTFVGKIKIDKINGKIHYVEYASEDKGSRARAAATAISRYAIKGEYPEKAYFQG